ncbi:hypothetical protein Tco_0745966 [Tanacetum coccineum]
MPAASHPPKRLRADYGTTGGSATGGKSPSILNRLLQDSRLTVEQDEATTVATVATMFVSCCFLQGGKVVAMMREHSCGRGYGCLATEGTIYVLEWTVTKGFELNDGRLCANMIDHFTPPAFFKTVKE